MYLTGDEIKKPKDNWLLDLELAYGPVFTSDKLAMTATELVPDASPDTRAAWLEVMRRYPLFFEAKSRTEALAARLTASDDTQVFQAKMIAVLLKLKNDRHSLQDIWRELLTQYANDDDSGMESIEHMGLEEFHWTGTSRIYHYEVAEGVSPSVKDFMLWLFRLAWKGFVSGTAGTDTYANLRRDFESGVMSATLKRRSKNCLTRWLMNWTSMTKSAIWTSKSCRIVTYSAPWMMF